MSETSLVWGPLKREFDRRGWHSVRIENSACPGTPDVNVYVPALVNPTGGEVWIELKYSPVIKPRPLVLELGLRREQYIWLREAKNAGRECLLLARVEGRFYIWNDILSWTLAKSRANRATLLANSIFQSNEISELVDWISTMV